MTDLKAFHISDLISISSGRLVSTQGMDGIYKILSHMAGAELFTHQLPTVGRQADPVLREQHPFLNEIEVPTISSEEDAFNFAAEMAEKYGEYHTVAPLEKAHIPTFAEAIDAARAGKE